MFSHRISVVEFIPTRAPAMSESIRTLHISPYPVAWTNPLGLARHKGAPMPPNEDFYHRRHCDAPVVTPLPYSVFEYLERYPACFDAGRFRWMWNDGNEMQGRNRLGKVRDTAVSGWPKRWNH